MHREQRDNPAPSSQARHYPCADGVPDVNARCAELAWRVVHLLGQGEAAANGVAERQHRLITIDQARICGLGLKAVTGRVRRGSWSRLRRGVYAVGGGEPPQVAHVLAAVVASAPGAVASHRTAACLWGIVDRAPELLHVTVVGSRNPGTFDGVRVHRTRHIPQTRWRQGVPLTSPVDTLLDLAGDLAPAGLEAAIALAYRKRLVTRAELGQAIDRAGRRKGVANLRAATRDPKVTKSANERLLVDLIRAAELPNFDTNIVVAGKEVDVYWRDARLAIEVDAFATHGDEATFEDDHVLDADFNAADIRMLRFTGRRIRAAPHAVIARIAAVLALRLGGLPAPRRRR